MKKKKVKKEIIPKEVLKHPLYDKVAEHLEKIKSPLPDLEKRKIKSWLNGVIIVDKNSSLSQYILDELEKINIYEI
jgi:hypothetical protein